MAISGGPPAARVRFAHTARSARKPRFFLKFKRCGTLWDVVDVFRGLVAPCGRPVTTSASMSHLSCGLPRHLVSRGGVSRLVIILITNLQAPAAGAAEEAS